VAKGNRFIDKENVVAGPVTKSAIITGVSDGIGGSVAKRLVKDGLAVVVNYAGKPATG
jgi:3-oxoacyl-[acyl-carrier protein] reductase